MASVDGQKKGEAANPVLASFTPLMAQICSLANLLRAFDRVEQNQGAPGVDGVTIDEFSIALEPELERLGQELASGRYQPNALLRIHVPKKAGGKRALSIPTVRDRVAQTSAWLVLAPALDEHFEEGSFGYREGRSVGQAVDRILALREVGYEWVVDADIRSYFDEIPHDRLLETVRRFINEQALVSLIAAWLGVDVQERGRRSRLVRGVPQGSPISPLLANLYLDSFDETCEQHGYRLVRYADDFVVLCRSRPAAEAALELSERVLGQLKLELNASKTRVVHFNQGFKYLGVQFLRSLAFRPRFTGTTAIEAAPQVATSVSPRAPSMPPGLAPPGGPTSIEAALAAEGLLPKATSGEGGNADAVRAWTDEDVPANHDPVLRSLFVVTQGAELGKESERFVVRAEGRADVEVPALKVDQAIVFGNVRVTTPAMQFALSRDIPIYLLSTGGRFLGAITSDAGERVEIVARQFEFLSEPDRVLATSKALVAGKLANARTLLLRIARRKGAVGAATKAARQIEALAKDIGGAGSLDQLRGVEGAAAASYFGAWPELVGPLWEFDGRERRPPTDPVNSLLSYGYTVLLGNVYSLLRSVGLHPHVGVFHALRSGHPGLASDLMEEFRAVVVDATVLRVIRRGQLVPAHFSPPREPGEPCRLGPQARTVFTRELERTLNRSIVHPDAEGPCDYRRAIALQARRLAATFMGASECYEPMVTR